jgi:CheY-like chemotaxis protein
MTEPTYDVLVVDDEPVLCRAIRKIVSRDGFSIDDADSASGGLTKLKSNRYQMVLCDLMLAGVGGLGLLRAARRVLDDLPVVMITGYATLGSAVDSFRGGAFDFLPKPFDDDELMAVVKRALAFHQLDPADRRVSPYRKLIAGTDGHAPPPESVHAIGTHSWALIDSEGTATIGIGETFNGLRGAWRDIYVPEAGESTRQGRPCVRITTDEGAAERNRGGSEPDRAAVAGRPFGALAATHRAERTGKRIVELNTMLATG